MPVENPNETFELEGVTTVWMMSLSRIIYPTRPLSSKGLRLARPPATSAKLPNETFELEGVTTGNPFLHCRDVQPNETFELEGVTT